MSPFEFNDYRSFLNAVCDEEGAPRGLRASLAREAGCQASYFSQVLKNRVHLNEDQLLGITTFLALSAADIEFALLLLRHERAATPKLKDYLNQLTNSARERRRKFKFNIDNKGLIHDAEVASIYVSSWIYCAVHLLSSCPDFQNIETIAKRLALPTEKVKDTLLFLERSGLVEKKASRWIYSHGIMQLSSESPHQTMLQASRRDLATRSLQLRAPNAMHFSSMFGTDEESLKQIQELFVKLIEKSHKIIEGAEFKNLSCMCIDLFDVI